MVAPLENEEGEESVEGVEAEVEETLFTWLKLAEV